MKYCVCDGLLPVCVAGGLQDLRSASSPWPVKNLGTQLYKHKEMNSVNNRNELRGELFPRMPPDKSLAWLIP